MSSAQLFFLGALLIAASVFTAFLVSPAAAARGGPYALMQHSNTTANAGVFRIDTSSGGVSYCYVTRDSELVCSKEVF